MMKISIITVVWNNQETIRYAIESVLNQTYKNIEYIIIDGASTDGTVKIVQSYGSKITKFRTEEDNGLYDAMNKGLLIASGDVIGILNSDDVYFDNTIIEKVMNKLKIESVDSLYGDLVYVNQNNLNHIFRYWKSSIYIKDSFSKGWHPPHPTFFVKKEIYEKYGYFDLTMKVSADFELMLRFLEKHQISTTYLDETIVKMRVGGESNKSIKNIILGNKSILRALKKHGIKINYVTFLFNRLVPKVLQRIKSKIINIKKVIK